MEQGKKIDVALKKRHLVLIRTVIQGLGELSGDELSVLHGILNKCREHVDDSVAFNRLGDDLQDTADITLTPNEFVMIRGTLLASVKAFSINHMDDVVELRNTLVEAVVPKQEEEDVSED